MVTIWVYFILRYAVSNTEKCSCWWEFLLFPFLQLPSWIACNIGRNNITCSNSEADQNGAGRRHEVPAAIIRVTTLTSRHNLVRDALLVSQPSISGSHGKRNPASNSGILISHTKTEWAFIGLTPSAYEASGGFGTWWLIRFACSVWKVSCPWQTKSLDLD